jgi:hypothetical protein
MDVETTADRFVGIDVSKARVDVHVRPDGTAFFSATARLGCERQPNTPHSAVMPPSTNSRAPVT